MRFGIGAQGESFNGKIDDIGIWNRALTQQEISSIYYQTTSTTCLPDYVPTNGLVGYWPFCGNANDASSNGNNGTVNGASLTTDRNGNANSAYNFDGINDYIQVPHSSSISLTGDITMSAWVKTNGSNSQNYQSIISKRETYWTWEYMMTLSYHNSIIHNTKLLAARALGNGNQEQGWSSTPYNINTWEHWVVTISNNQMKIYKNGVLDHTQVFSLVPVNQVCPLLFGKNTLVDNTEQFKGNIDDIGIWNRALTAQEISNLYNPCATPPAAPTGALTQTFCASPAPTVASLTATGTGIQWYAAASGGTALATTTALVNGTTYYATQTVSNCESTDRLAVNVTLNDPQITASATTVCSGTAVSLSASTTATLVQNCNLPTNLQIGLVGYWPFCGNANDTSGNNNNGTVNGATLTTDRFGNVNSAYSFDGLNDNIVVQNSPSLQINSWSINCWFKTGFLGHNRITSKDNPSNPYNDMSLITLNGNLYISSSINGQTNNPLPICNTFVADNNWHHAVAIRANGSYNIYIDGNLCSTVSDNFSQLLNSNPLYIGSPSPFPSQYFNGQLDDIAIYNRALSPAEIAQLYTSAPTYLWSTGATTATINPSPTATTTYWCDVTVNGVTCRKEVTITVNSTTPAPIAAATQTFCVSPAPNVASLSATGTGLQWYDAATGGNLLASTATLTDGQTVYASQTENSCESTTRTAVSVSINDPQITASATTVCAGTAVNLSASTTAAGVTANCTLPANLQNGLVGYWPFCGNAIDASGNGNNGTVNGATLTTDRFGNIGNAYQFNGSSNFIEIPNSNSITNISEISVSAWVNINLWFQSGGESYFPILHKSNLQGQYGKYALNLVNQGGISHLNSQENGFGYNNWSYGEWKNIVMIFSNNRNKIYIDGELISIVPCGIFPNPINSSLPLIIGMDKPGLVEYANGKIDDVSIWNRELTPSEISQLFGQTTYLWSTGETTATINPSPTTTTTYWCDVTVNGLTCRKEITITVNPSTNPTFNQVAAICSGATIDALPTISTNGITGTWSPELNNTTTTTYTFTPTAGQCANTTTMTIVVNDSYYTFYVDADGDGIGAGTKVYGCLDEYGNLPPGYSWDNYDCNDNDANINWYGEVYIDADGDGWGAGEAISVCIGQDYSYIPPGYAYDNYDCNDNDANVYMSSDWLGDGFNVYIDADGDGFGSGNPTSLCMNVDRILPQGYSYNNSDCDDHFFSSNGLCPLTLNVKLYLQGYYKSNQNQMTPLRKNAGVSQSDDDVDQVTVSLYSKYDVINPIIATATAVVGTNGTVGLQFAVLPDEYYILVEHKNTIKTWSATPVTIANGTTYDFTTAASQAYGNNQIEVAPGVYAIYSGDMNQDGTINEADLPIFTTANTTAAHGYVVSDLNGDGSVDLLDYPIYKNNAAASVNAVRPVPLPIASLPNVTIGTQVWQSTNLDVATYRDGTPIPQVTDPTQWTNLTTGAWCYYNNTTANGTTYGKLYNWYAVAGIHDNDPNTPNKILAPEGWHIPTDAEWTTLTTFLGGESVAGGKMKATGTSLWQNSGHLTPGGATNSSGFTGLPAGYRYVSGTFMFIGYSGFWWSSSEYSTANALLRNLDFNSRVANRGYNVKRSGFSVRCLRD